MGAALTYLLVESWGEGGGGRTEDRAFTLAGEAVNAAVGLMGSAAEADWRAALYTCRPGEECLEQADRIPVRAGELRRQARPGQILVPAATAVLLGHALPPGVELVDTGVRQWGDQPPERVYQMRSASEMTGGDDDPFDRSNLGWAHRAVPGPLAGRDTDLAAALAAWRRTRRGRRQIVQITGEAGIGKTALAAAVALRAHAQGGLVLYGRWDRERTGGYQAVQEALTAYARGCSTARLRADLGEGARHVARLCPDLARQVGVPGPPGPDHPERDRYLLFLAIERWLSRMAERRPVLLVLDDLQWAEAESFQLIRRLHTSPSHMALLVVVTLRERESEGGAPYVRPPGAADRPTDVTHVDLGGLDLAAVAQLVGHALGQTVAADDHATRQPVEALAQGTAGNPLFLLQVLRDLPDEADEIAVLHAIRRATPERLGDVVRWHMAQLPMATGRFLEAAAVIGPEFDVELVADATGSPSLPMVAEALQHAERARLIRPQPPGDGFGFVHDMFYEALRDRVDPTEAARLHRRVGEALARQAEEGRSVDPAEVARHHLEGADHQTADAAVRWARAAATEAARQTAYAAAVGWLRRAVEVHDRFAVPDDADAARGCELRLELAEAHYRAAELERRDQTLTEAAGLARRLDRPDLFARAALGFGGQLPVIAVLEAADRLLAEAMDRIGDPEGPTHALLLARRAQVGQLLIPHPVRRATCEQAVAIARGREDPALLATALLAQGVALGGPDDPERELQIAAEIRELAERLASSDLLLQADRLSIQALLMVGRHRAARERLAAYAELAREVHHPDHQHIAGMYEILWATLEGRWTESAALADRLQAELDESGYPESAVLRFAQRTVPAWLRGRAAELRDRWDSLRSSTMPTNWWAASVWLDAVGGRRDRARAELSGQDPHGFVADLNRNYLWWPTMCACAIAAATTGDRAWAAAVHEALVPYQELNCVYAYTVFAGAVDHHLGTLAAVLERRDEAVERLEQALKRHENLGAAPFVALSARWLAHVSTDRDRAAALNRRSDELADRYGLGGLPHLQI